MKAAGVEPGHDLVGDGRRWRRDIDGDGVGRLFQHRELAGQEAGVHVVALAGFQPGGDRLAAAREEDENRIQLLKDAIKEGLDSGIAKNFDANENLKKLKAKKSQNV